MGLFDNLFKRVDLDALAVGVQVFREADALRIGETAPLPVIRFKIGKKRFTLDRDGLTRTE